MPRKREAHVEGERVDDDELHVLSVKKSRKAQHSAGAAGDGANGNDTEEAGNEITSADGRDNDHGPTHARSISRASPPAPKYPESQENKDEDNGRSDSESDESQENKDEDNGRSDSESDEDALEDEEIEEDITPRRRSMAKAEAYDDSNQSSSSSSDGESDEDEEELDDGEQKPDESTAFGRAFQKIMKKKLPSTALTEAMGPMLSAHKQLVTKKLEEAAEGRKAKSESKKAKQALREKGHTVPTRFPAAKDKELLKLATRGVVKLFNAVSKAQSVQEAAVSKASEAKEVAKRSKSTFLAMLQGGNGAVSQSLNTQKQPSDSKKEGAADGQPGWSALRDTFMLGKSNLKDWDKKEEDAAELKGAGSSGDDSDSSD